MQYQEIIRTHPDVRGSTNDTLLRAVEAAFDCAQACIACADACLAEPEVDALRQCIRLNLDCADVCSMAGRLGTRRTGSNEELLQATLGLCAEACRTCGAECRRHARHHEHCAICAESCEQCARACDEAAGSIQPGLQ